MRYCYYVLALLSVIFLTGCSSPNTYVSANVQGVVDVDTCKVYFRVNDLDGEYRAKLDSDTCSKMPAAITRSEIANLNAWVRYLQNELSIRAHENGTVLSDDSAGLKVKITSGMPYLSSGVGASSLDSISNQLNVISDNVGTTPTSSFTTSASIQGH